MILNSGEKDNAVEVRVTEWIGVGTGEGGEQRVDLDGWWWWW